MGLMGLMRPKNALSVPTVTLAAPRTAKPIEDSLPDVASRSFRRQGEVGRTTTRTSTIPQREPLISQAVGDLLVKVGLDLLIGEAVDDFIQEAVNDETLCFQLRDASALEIE